MGVNCLASADLVRLFGTAMVIAVVAGGTSCGGDSSNTTERVAYQDITSDFPDLRYDKQTTKVFRSQSELERVVRERGRGASAELPDIDFSARMLIVVAAGVRSSAGYRLKIIRVSEDSDKIAIHIRETSPPPDSVAATVLTYPFVALTISKSDKSVEAKFAR